jgi:hypothetical protein
MWPLLFCYKEFSKQRSDSIIVKRKLILGGKNSFSHTALRNWFRKWGFQGGQYQSNCDAEQSGRNADMWQKNLQPLSSGESLMLQTASQILTLRVMTPTANKLIFAFSKCIWGKVTKCDILNIHLTINHFNLCNPCWGNFWLQFKG